MVPRNVVAVLYLQRTFSFFSPLIYSSLPLMAVTYMLPYVAYSLCYGAPRLNDRSRFCSGTTVKHTAQFACDLADVSSLAATTNIVGCVGGTRRAHADGRQAWRARMRGLIARVRRSLRTFCRVVATAPAFAVAATALPHSPFPMPLPAIYHYRYSPDVRGFAAYRTA